MGCYELVCEAEKLHKRIAELEAERDRLKREKSHYLDMKASDEAGMVLSVSEWVHRASEAEACVNALACGLHEIAADLWPNPNLRAQEVLEMLGIPCWCPAQNGK